MHHDETLSETPYGSDNLQLIPEIKNHLSETAKWARFLGITGLVTVGLMVIGAFFFGAFMNFMDRSPLNQQNNPAFTSGAFSVAMSAYFLLIALLYFFPSYYLFQFGKKTRLALNNNDQIDLNLAFSRLKSFFKFFGIITAILLVLYGGALIFGLLFGVLMGNR